MKANLDMGNFKFMLKMMMELLIKVTLIKQIITTTKC